MINLSMTDLSQILSVPFQGEDLMISSVATDTRTMKPGALFVALCGARFDGHHFAAQAIENGAVALLVSRQLPLSVPQIVVPDTIKALGNIASRVHQQCKTLTAAITGSCGKTTVKEMTAAILSQKGSVLYTQGNLNNDIGVPLTLLRSRPEDDYAIIELGANHIGEIAYTTQLVYPDIALVNNVAAAHLEGFGSINGVKSAKGEIYQGLKAGGAAIVNLDSWGGDLWQEVLSDKIIKTFSVSDQNADFYASSVVSDNMAYPCFHLHTPAGSCSVHLNIMGEHNVSNALAATALAMEMGATLEDVCQGLEKAKNMKGRVDVSRLTEHVRLIDDSYNASVPSMIAAIDILGQFSTSSRWLILGNMAELGHDSLALHQQVAEHAAQFGFEHVLTYGEEAQIISDICNGIHFDSHQDIVNYIYNEITNSSPKQHMLLVKGANSAGMSEIVAALKEKYS